MYGTRDAGMLWEMVYTDALKAVGFVQGVASPCCFHHPAWGVAVVVHGDDFTALETPEGLDKSEQEMCSAFACKLEGRIGHEATDLKEVRVLNRMLYLTQQGLHDEADPRHVEMLARSLGLDAPGTRPSPQG